MPSHLCKYAGKNLNLNFNVFTEGLSKNYPFLKTRRINCLFLNPAYSLTVNSTVIGCYRSEGCSNFLIWITHPTFSNNPISFPSDIFPSLWPSSVLLLAYLKVRQVIFTQRHYNLINATQDKLCNSCYKHSHFHIL